MQKMRENDMEEHKSGDTTAGKECVCFLRLRK